MQIIVIPFFSPVSNENTRSKLISDISSSGVSIVNTEEYLNAFQSLESVEKLPHPNLFLFVGTGGTENAISEFISKLEGIRPIILLSYNLNNSLPAAMEARTFLTQQGYPTRIQHGSMDELLNYLTRHQKYVKVREKLAVARIGLVGTPSEWLIASQVDENQVKRKWGTNFVHIPITNLTQIKNQHPNALGKIGQQFMDRAINCDVSINDVSAAELAVHTLTELFKEYDLSAISVECFTFLLETNITSCFALSYLNDLGMVAGCEGDLPSTFTMLVMNYLSEKPVFMANVVDIDKETNRVKFAHCTIPTSILNKYSIMTHFETNKSVAIRGFLPEDKLVTILKIGGKDLSKWWATKGLITKNLVNDAACRTHIEIQIDRSVDYFFQDSIANHHCLVLGDYIEEVTEFLNFSLNSE
ncbi:MAG: fucose isomerase [Promethearchaeota archaeon]